ncbi:hypothetical protein ABKV19_013359 [Rosa sericea]
MGLVIHQIEFGFLLITLSRRDYQESMQRSIWIILLPLFLVLLLGVSLVTYCYSDIGNSERLKSTNFLDSVMASTNTTKWVKRLLEGGCKSNQFDQVKSKIWKRSGMKQTIARYNKGDESSETALVESRAELALCAEKIPRHLTKASLLGAGVSTVAALAMMFLLWNGIHSLPIVMTETQRGRLEKYKGHLNI